MPHPLFTWRWGACTMCGKIQRRTVPMGPSPCCGAQLRTAQYRHWDDTPYGKNPFPLFTTPRGRPPKRGMDWPADKRTLQ